MHRRVGPRDLVDRGDRLARLARRQRVRGHIVDLHRARRYLVEAAHAHGQHLAVPCEFVEARRGRAHPLREVGTRGTALTVNGKRALTELARRGVLGVLSGHVHDPFDILEDTPEGPVRMIGAGTLSQRLRSTPPSFNEIGWDGETLTVRVRNLDEVPTKAMQIDDVPEDALPPREPGEPVAPMTLALSAPAGRCAGPG